MHWFAVHAQRLPGKQQLCRRPPTICTSPTAAQVLNVPDLVLMVWALAVLEQYGCRLYRHTTFRAKRLPDGVPSQPRLRRLLREATTLHRWASVATCSCLCLSESGGHVLPCVRQEALLHDT